MVLTMRTIIEGDAVTINRSYSLCETRKYTFPERSLAHINTVYKRVLYTMHFYTMEYEPL